MSELNIQQTFELALQHHQGGRLQEAERLYRLILAHQPEHIDAIHNLGVLSNQAGHNSAAVDLILRAIALNPDFAEAHSNLGSVLRDIGQLDRAIIACRKAASLRPDFAEAHNNLGNALKDRGQLDEAIAAYRQAIALNPRFAEAHCQLGTALRAKGQVDEAIAAHRQAIALRADYAEAYNNLGVVLKEKGEVEEAIVAFERAIAIRPDLAEAHGNLGTALMAEGRLDEAIAADRQAIALNPNLPEAHSNLIFALNYHPEYDAKSIAREQGRWNHRHAEPLRALIRPHTNKRNPDRRLRIGYFSPDFRDHVVGRNLLPLFLHRDRRQSEVTCYAQVPIPDAVTSQFERNADRWRSTVGLGDEGIAQQIREDEIDILVDLALHTAGNRLLVFARKPSPVQVTFAGYPGSTGLSTIDYRLSDPYLDPPDMDESIYSERTIRLAHSFWCYDPLENREIPVNSVPAGETGAITFGCLNNFFKINDSVLALWAQVLRQVPGSRLLLLVSPGILRVRTLDRLSREGIASERIEFIARQSRLEYLKLYHRVDLGLDSSPYNGHTTSLDSFWMGVPVVTLVGQTAVSRAGWSQLSNLGLTELAGNTPEQFVRIAVELANNLPRLKVLRAKLRHRMEQSPLMDASGFARSVEAAYRQMWNAWCEKAASTV